MSNNSREMACHTTPRLDAIIKILENSRSVADVGCDHAYLSILLAKSENFEKIVATDIGEGPLSRAKNNICRFGFDDKIDLRLGDGLSPVQKGETDAVVIAGMGATVISSILKNGEDVARACDILVLQPMTSTHELREFLYKNYYTIEKEILVQEDRRIYTIIVAKSGKTNSFCSADCYISPALLKSDDALLEKYFSKQKTKVAKILSGMKKAKNKIDEKTISYYSDLLCELEIYEKDFIKR